MELNARKRLLATDSYVSEDAGHSCEMSARKQKLIGGESFARAQIYRHWRTNTFKELG